MSQWPPSPARGPGVSCLPCPLSPCSSCSICPCHRTTERGRKSEPASQPQLAARGFRSKPGHGRRHPLLEAELLAQAPAAPTQPAGCALTPSALQRPQAVCPRHTTQIRTDHPCGRRPGGPRASQDRLLHRLSCSGPRPGGTEWGPGRWGHRVPAHGAPQRST